MSSFSLVIIVGWGTFCVYWLISALRTRSQTERQQSCLFLRLYLILLVLGYLLLISHPAAFGPLLRRFLPDNIGVKLIGIIIMFLGLGFAAWARVHLGKYWSGGRASIKVDHKLIQTGPYKIVRHPIYAGMLFGFIGTAIVIGEIRAPLTVVFILAAFLIKILTEEKLLLEEFGSTYLRYKKEVKMLIPFIV